jgi:hypothetical protein
VGFIIFHLKFLGRDLVRGGVEKMTIIRGVSFIDKELH